MSIFSKVLLFSLGFLFTSGVAASEQAVASKMSEYWGLYSSGQLHEASEHVYFADLEGMKEHILPLFVRATRSDIQQVRQMTSVFFGSVSPENAHLLPPNEVFVRLHTLLRVLQPEAFEVLERGRMTINDIHFGGTQEATVHYSMEVDAQRVRGTERLTLHEGAWYLRTNESPEDVALKIQRLFEL